MPPVTSEEELAVQIFAEPRACAELQTPVKNRWSTPMNAAMLVVLAVSLSGCFALERGNGVRWDCEGYVTFGTGEYPDALATYPPGQLWVCANEDVPLSEIVNACESYCERRNATWYGFIPVKDKECTMTATMHPGPTECSRRRYHSPPSLLSVTSDGRTDGVVALDDELPDVFPLQGDPSNYQVRLDPTSRVSISASTHDGRTAASGTIGFLVDEHTCDAAGRCDFIFTRMNLALEDFTLERCAICREFDVKNVSVILSGAPFMGKLDQTGTFQFTREAEVWVEVSGRADGNEFVLPVEASQPFSGSFDVATGAFALDATLTSGDGSVRLQLTGSIDNRPPVARIDGPERVECGYVASFSAAGSFDPDGSIANYAWAASESAGIGMLSGVEVNMELSLGLHEIGLMVTDSRGMSGFANHSVTVEDTSGPVIEPPADIVLELCEGTTSIQVPVVEALDTCDGAVDTRARLVELNGLSTDRLLTDSFDLGPDTTATVAYSAMDASGNTTVVYLPVSTFRGASCCPALPGNGRECWAGGSDNDTIDGGNGGDWIFGGPGDDYLVGGNGPDVLYGGPGDDVLLGMNGPDRLFGGAGNDRLEGGAGPDELEGGPGADIMLGGDGPDTFWIRSSCDAWPGEVIDGGSGHDVLHSPLSLEELTLRGVEVIGIEEIVIIDDEGGCDA